MYPTDKIYCTVKTFILITGQYKLKKFIIKFVTQYNNNNNNNNSFFRYESTVEPSLNGTIGTGKSVRFREVSANGGEKCSVCMWLDHD